MDFAIDDAATVATQAEAPYEMYGCVSTTMYSIVRAVTCDLLDRIIEKDLKDHCEGCVIEHTTQSLHTCMQDPEDHYLHVNAKRLLRKLFKPWFKYTLGKALNLCGISLLPPLNKIQTIAETVVCELREESFFRGAAQHIRYMTVQQYTGKVRQDIVDFWEFHNSLDHSSWETSSTHSSSPASPGTD